MNDKKIGLATARWKYQEHTPIHKEIKLGKIYYFQGGSAYVHEPNNTVILGYRTKKFLLLKGNKTIKISVYPYSRTNQKVINWIETWAGKEDKIVTPGGRTILLNGDTLRCETEFIYFVLNTHCSAVKIGRAKDVDKRLKSLQSASPVRLKVLKIIDTKAGKEAKNLEKSLHERFAHLRLTGEWFRYEDELLEYIKLEKPYSKLR